MKLFVNFLFIFIMLSVVSSILIDGFNANFGSTSFWSEHGIFFLLCLAVFPRLTLFFSAVPSGGLTWWLGFFICPRVLVAVLATGAYWQTNPVLVAVAWLFVLGGEASEKLVIHKRVFKTVNRYTHPKNDSSRVIDV